MVQPTKPSKLRNLRALFVVVLLAGLGIAGFFAWKMLRGIVLPEAPLANVPRAATIVGYVRVNDVVHSEVFRSLLSPELIEARLERIRERCGFDPATQIEDAILFVDGANALELDAIGVVARGPFEHQKLNRCFREAFREEGLGEMRMTQIDGVPAAAPAEGPERAAFLGQHGIAIGHEASVRQVIGVVRDQEASAEGDPVLARLWDRVATGRDLVLVGHLPTNWQQRVRELVGTDPGAEWRATVDSIRAFGLGATFSTGLQIGGVLAMKDQAAATDVTTRVRGQLDALTNNMLVSLTPLGPVVRSIRTEQRGQDFTITVELPRDRLDRMMEFAMGWQNDWQQRATPPSPGAPGAPTPTVIPPSPAPAP